MRIALITPARARSRAGNRATAYRWAAFLRESGHSVTVAQRWNGAPADLMIALHARRSHESIRDYAERCPERPLIVTLTGTDLYRDIKTDRDAQASLALATRLIVLNEIGARALPPPLRAKTRVVIQSCVAPRRPPSRACAFEIVVSGHLREEKDPFRAAAAAALLPPESRICITHIGGAMSPAMAEEARAWMAREPRYRWHGEVPHVRALRMLAGARLMVISSRMEGGANVVCEALASGVPVIASRIAGNVGLLGAGYRGYFPVSDERALARLLTRAERDAAFYALLARACAQRAPLVAPERERDALSRVIEEAANAVPPARKAA